MLMVAALVYNHSREPAIQEPQSSVLGIKPAQGVCDHCPATAQVGNDMGQGKYRTDTGRTWWDKGRCGTELVKG